MRRNQARRSRAAAAKPKRPNVAQASIDLVVVEEHAATPTSQHTSPEPAEKHQGADDMHSVDLNENTTQCSVETDVDAPVEFVVHRGAGTLVLST